MGDKKIAVIDAETDPFDGRTYVSPFIWGYYDGDNYEEFTKTDDLCHFLAAQEDTIVYAHNGGKFDFHLGLLDYANDFQNIKIINGRVGQFMLGDCEIRDSVLILPIKLADYQKDDIDYDIFTFEERHKPHNYKKIQEYLYTDCVYLWDLISQFIERFGLNLTLAGTAFKFWENLKNEKVERSNDLFYEYFSPYYYGGRVECFASGQKKENFEFYDINSAYPYAMLSDHPYSTEFRELSKVGNDIINDEHFGAYLVKVKAISHGALPYREARLKKDGEPSISDKELYFPNDDQPREFTVTGWEILTGLETGTLDILDWQKVYTFERYENFREYIDYFYEERKKAKAIGDKANNIFCKLMMNSLYGRFAMMPDRYRTYINIPPEFLQYVGKPLDEHFQEVFDKLDVSKFDPEIFEYAGEISDFTLIQRKLFESEQTWYNIATSASITGFVRAFMWKHICMTDTPLYCDTDSIAALKFNGFDEGKELGQWEKEGEFDSWAIAGKKMYSFRYRGTGDYKTATKGVNLQAHEIWDVAGGQEVTYRPIAPTYSYHKPPTFTPRKVNRNAKIAVERQ